MNWFTKMLIGHSCKESDAKNCQGAGALKQGDLPGGTSSTRLPSNAIIYSWKNDGGSGSHGVRDMKVSGGDLVLNLAQPTEDGNSELTLPLDWIQSSTCDLSRGIFCADLVPNPRFGQRTITLENLQRVHCDTLLPIIRHSNDAASAVSASQAIIEPKNQGRILSNVPDRSAVLETVQATSPQELPLVLPGGVLLVMVRIPAGTFLMGSPESERNREGDEGPQHSVTLTLDWYMGKYPVTQQQWVALMGTNPSEYKDNGLDCPVEQVSWNDICMANGFLDRLNAHLRTTDQTGAGRFRLPTEAEWERATRGGSQTRFGFGDALGGDDEWGENAVANPYVWWHANTNGTTQKVGKKRSNPYGLFDVHGNVYEWCADWYGEYSASSQRDPTGPATGPFRITRGGCWGGGLKYCRSANRGNVVPGKRWVSTGFRLAATI